MKNYIRCGVLLSSCYEWIIISAEMTLCMLIFQYVENIPIRELK